jgi:hypothetical protein
VGKELATTWSFFPKEYGNNCYGPDWISMRANKKLMGVWFEVRKWSVINETRDLRRIVSCCSFGYSLMLPSLYFGVKGTKRMLSKNGRSIQTFPIPEIFFTANAVETSILQGKCRIQNDECLLLGGDVVWL